ncbi:unconventional myosin-IXa-like isoform X2 [Plodia interpunctella]|uniref:unconventional myosin-IXa-like isoform X2 n=1 Tax=Plodia interpunctella TaxID=58824 RepID=UPI002368D89F|nr:unconventional myosin-IXa-like isoform X2 [Plodia interpunctella]XP_053611262.1 unconventional myosin-IXa-like isoform X2 [Plodia interpunctella]XP_053611263.1 unconventional myosin-IXa-like isoform X2 [Plodia interpunctella]
MAENYRYIVQVFVGALSAQYEALSVEASKQTSSEEIVCCIADKLNLNNGSGGPYELAEVVGDVVSGECKERRLAPDESPVGVMLLWPNNNSEQYYRFYLREKIPDEPWMENFSVDPQLIKDYFQRFLYQPKDREYPDLCQLPELNEQTLLNNLRARFAAGYIYTYVGSILIALNPFKFYPIYNPKYVKLYQNKRIGSTLPPHIFAVADAAYHSMLRERTNQCIVISGESGSGKTESTNFLLHHLTALSQKGSHGSGVEQTILSAGPVLEAFGNAKTAHNNNSSRFGKFIQVNYKENGMVHGAVVQKYLLEKSRICSQGRNERNYHVFYYLLAGASEQEKEQLHLLSVDKYNYLSRTGCSVVPGVDEQYEFSRLKQSMDMVGFTMDKRRRLFAVLSAVLLLGNVEFQPRKSYHHDEAVGVRNPEVVSLISSLLHVKQETLLAALTSKRARASGETLVINYRLPEAIATRDAMAKCLYGALFDWIVMQVNHALLSKKDTLREHQGHSIGVLDIFGFEDFGPSNSFEQLCINYANEHLQYYFNQHVFKYEQEEYRREGIRWTDIGFSDNTQCLQLIEGKPSGLLCLLDDQCNFPWATNETLLQKFNSVHEDNQFYEKPQRREPAFVVKHYAGRVKYQVTAMREKNLDLMRQDIVSVLKNSSLAFVRELVGVDPVAVFRWAIVRAFFRGYFAFHEAGRKHRVHRTDGALRVSRASIHAPNDSIIRTPNRTPAKVGLNRAEVKQRVDSARADGKTKNYRIAETRTRRVEREFDDADVMQRASQIVMKNKSFRPRERAKKGLKNLQSVKTLAGRTAAPTGKRKQPLTVAAQFQHSLAALMETLNQANPFFIRCIKSNSDKIPNVFDEETVQRQLRYTGMLETVRIRQAGYNVRLTYEEFIQLYRILLPKGLLSSQADVRHFLATLNLDRDNYQLGATKIFMRESEQTKLEYRLHQQIMASIIAIQRWFRAVLERRRFLALRRASRVLQGYCRQWLVARVEAATKVQAWFRGNRVRRWYLKLKKGIVGFQAAAKGYLLRKTLPALRRPRRILDKNDHDNKAGDEHEDDTNRAPSLEELKNIIDTQLDMLINRGVENMRQLRATQSLPIASLEKKRDTFVPPAAAFENKNVTNAQVTDITAVNKSKIQKEERKKKKEVKSFLDIGRWNAEGVAVPNKITPADLADELLWLRLDQNILASKTKTNDKNIELVDVTERINNCSSGDSSDTNKSTGSRRSSPQVYQRSLSSTTLQPPALLSLPPVRRDPRPDHKAQPVVSTGVRLRPAETCPPPAPPARASRRPPRLALDALDALDAAVSVADHRDGKRHPARTSSELMAPLLETSSVSAPISDAACGAGLQRSGRGPAPALRRRNSDPAPAPAEPRAPDPRSTDFIGTTTNGLFRIAGHRFRKGTRFSKDDKCVYCHEAIDAFITQGQRCIDCKQLYHTKCIQNKGVITMPCTSPVVANAKTRPRNRKRIIMKEPYNMLGDQAKGSVTSNFNLTGTSEFMDRTDKIISDATELQAMQNFITKKIYQMGLSDNEKQSEVDRVFKHALSEFKDNLVATYSVVETRGSALKYKDLIGNFLHVMETVCAREGSTLSITMGVNAFRGFMDEFMSQHETDKARTKRKKDKKRKVDDPIQYKGHIFILSMINIPTECEICKTFFMWPIERSLICQCCKLASHKKCYMKVNTQCRKDSAAIVGVLDVSGREQYGVVTRGLVFGVPLCELPTGDSNIPIVVDRLITTIEMTGLYNEGLYRKSGLSSKVRELRRLLDERPEEGVERLDTYAVHVRASVLKGFFRDLPEPLLTFDLYDDFILAADITDPQERVSSIFTILKKLPKPNFDLVERLIFHLARVALRESHNRMGPNALAIVFAPCILRTRKVQPAQDSLHDINKQTTCLETILQDKMRTVRGMLADIATLEDAYYTATDRLSTQRSTSASSRPDDQILVGHIHEIQKEKAILTSHLPTLIRATSDDDLLSTTDHDGEFGSSDDLSTAASLRSQRLLHRQLSSDDPIMV